MGGCDPEIFGRILLDYLPKNLYCSWATANVHVAYWCVCMLLSLLVPSLVNKDIDIILLRVIAAVRYTVDQNSAFSGSIRTTESYFNDIVGRANLLWFAFLYRRGCARHCCGRHSRSHSIQRKLGFLLLSLITSHHFPAILIPVNPLHPSLPWLQTSQYHRCLYCPL